MSDTAIVTGASGGLGSAIVARLVDDYDVIIAADVRGEQLAAVTDEWSHAGRARVLPVVCDVSSPGDVAATVEAAVAEGDLKGLVNAAGVGTFIPLQTMTSEHWDRTFAINVRGAFLMSQQFLAHAAPPASIVHLSSVAARSGNDLLTDYGSSKAAVIELSHSVARIGAPRGIRSNSVMPGVIYTDMWRTAIDALKELDPSVRDVPHETVFAGMVAQLIPMGRPQEPQDVAEAVGFLLSDRAKNITAQTLSVDGGAILT
ncbi:SDR family NAD(P)-dependent oxidoreductase [Branchiibius sp. NY16-3462-2]|uniref:SDR family NAD(P)-dependent oxidoreductase n=1 Tax=Branchiibius sp. NY16-3462-2 TaxID=1807500 RepID=UPI00079AE495|nr:SDR family oxidoreductase [Branchiibius sp. NY16-3462-2]KYH44115.1 3-oxoacyl-ACP reductase [Branchiibius sp. NY16-3462-2]